MPVERARRSGQLTGQFGTVRHVSWGFPLCNELLSGLKAADQLHWRGDCDYDLRCTAWCRRFVLAYAAALVSILVFPTALDVSLGRLYSRGLGLTGQTRITA